MKTKLIPLLLCALLLPLLAACDQETGLDPVTDPDPASGGYTYVYKGKTVVLGSSLDTVQADLGEPTHYFEEASCAFQGMDKTLGYAGITITTYPHENGKDYILTINLLDDTTETPEGLYIGIAADKVTEALGDPADDSSEHELIYRKGGVILKILLQGGTVASITYTLDVL